MFRFAQHDSAMIGGMSFPVGGAAKK